jgi:BON domain
MERDERERLPYPSEDTGDLVDEPIAGQTDDPLVAREEGVPWTPPTDRVLSQVRDDESGPDAAATAPDDAGELQRDDAITLGDATRPSSGDELLADCLEALRRSDVVAGDRIQLAVDGSIVTVRGTVQSVDVLDEVLSIVGDVPGVDEVRDEVIVAGI